MPYGEEIIKLCREDMFRTNGTTIYSDPYVVRFHYQYSDPDFGKTMAEKLEQELRALLEDVSVKIVHDVGVVEVRSFLGDRGDILKTLLARYKEEKKVNPELVVCLGDSSVDEPMFS